MENSTVKRYSTGIPILFLLLFLSSIVGIIGASFRLDAARQGTDGFDTSSSEQTILTLKIIVASILTIVFLLVMIFGFVEVGEPPPYKAKYITQKFESKLQSFVNNLESWELILVLSVYITLPIGIAVSFIDSSTGYLWIAFASIGAVTWSYNYRMGTRIAIKRVLPKHSEISLNSLSQAVSRDQNRVKKTIMYLISYEDYPATYDFATQIITYHGSGNQEGENPLGEDVVIAENLTRKATKKKTTQPKLKPCPFCDTMPVDVRARFCHDCGASIVPAK